MAGESVFDKRLTTETTLDKVEGLLEHLNLPPKAISYIRAHLKIIKISLAIIFIAIIFLSLYGSYREKMIEEASSAFAKAMSQGKDAQTEALRQVTLKYSGTASALWAKIELAHLDMNKGSFTAAGEQYRKVLSELDKTTPLYPLVLFSLGQSLEAEKKFGEAMKEYDALKGYKGFEHIAYSSMGRIEEIQGNIEKAIAVYNNFLLNVGDDPSFAQARAEIDGKVARLKTRL